MNRLPVISGIGSGDDLQVKLHENRNNRWYPQLQSGFYFLGNREHYLYAKECKEDLVIPVGINTVEVTTVEDLVTSLKNGPLILVGQQVEYIRSTNCLTVYETITPSGGPTDTLLADSVDGNLVMLTTSSGEIMHSVPSTDHLVDRKYYYFDKDTRVVYVKRNVDDPNRIENLYATYLADTPKLLQEEILVVKQGVLKAALPRVMFAASGTVFDPVLIIPGTGTLAASGVANNIIYPETALEDGTLVGVRYYVDQSFLATVGSDASTTIQTLTSYEDNATIFWEGALVYSHFDSATLTPTENRYKVQLNPLYTGINSGFLYLSEPRHPAENLDRLSLFISPTILSNKTREQARITVIALDKDDNQLPNIPIDCWIENDDGVLNTIRLDDQTTTDYRGEAHFAFIASPDLYGIYTVSASALSASGTVVSTSSIIKITDPMTLTDAVDAGKVFLYLNNRPDALGRYDLFIYLTNQAGIPLLSSQDVFVWCDKGRLVPNITVGTTGTLAASNAIKIDFEEADNLIGLRVAVCKYIPTETTDRIYARPDGEGVIYKFTGTPLEVRL